MQRLLIIVLALLFCANINAENAIDPPKIDEYRLIWMVTPEIGVIEEPAGASIFAPDPEAGTNAIIAPDLADLIAPHFAIIDEVLVVLNKQAARNTFNTAELTVPVTERLVIDYGLSDGRLIAGLRPTDATQFGAVFSERAIRAFNSFYPKSAEYIAYWRTMALEPLKEAIRNKGATATTGKTPEPTKTAPDTAATPAGMQPDQNEKFPVKDIRVRNVFQELNSVMGQVTNNSGKSYRVAYLKISFFDKDGRLLGAIDTSAINFESGETITFEEMTEDDLSSWRTYTVRLDVGI